MNLSAAAIAAAIPHDKALHVLAGLVAALAGLAAGHLIGWMPLVCAGIACSVAAFGREALNASGWSWADIAWTLAGGLLAGSAAWVGA